MGIRRTLLRPLAHQILVRKGKHAVPGTRSWFVEREIHYGGYISGVRRNLISPFDPRTPEQRSAGGMTGGDRMSPLHHDYGRWYEKFFAPFLNKSQQLTIVECGILRGTGLAMWSDLFPQARIIGLDIDLSNFNSHLSYLNTKGAFGLADPEVYEYDSYKDNQSNLTKILKGDSIDIFIDDAAHTNESILMNFNSVRFHLARQFVYVIEDNLSVYEQFRNEFPQYKLIKPRLPKFGISSKYRTTSFIVVSPLA